MHTQFHCDDRPTDFVTPFPNIRYGDEMASPGHSELKGTPLRLEHGRVITYHCFTWTMAYPCPILNASSANIWAPFY